MTDREEPESSFTDDWRHNRRITAEIVEEDDGVGWVPLVARNIDLYSEPDGEEEVVMFGGETLVDKVLAAELRLSGWPVWAVADLFGVTDDAIHRRWREVGV